MVSDPDVIDILYESLADDGMYRGYLREDNCLRCILHQNEPVREAKGIMAFCKQCMDELDMGKAVRMQMFGMRRQSKTR